MATISATPDQPEAPLFSDGLGDRVVTADGATGELLQVLHLRPMLTSVPSFEFALRERAARLANFRHASYARVRRVDRTMTASAPLAIVSDHVEGVRLSELLRVGEEHRLQLDTNAALYLIRQLVPAVALLHENARDAAHGLIAPERIVVTPQGRLVLVEHVLGAAIEQLHYGRDRLWQEFRIAMPATAGLPRFDHRADVAGIGIVALALLLGRPLAHDEYPYQVTALLNQAPARLGGATQPLSPGLRGWISRALQLEVRRAFASASEAATALEEVLAAEPQYVAAPVALEMFLSRYGTALLEPSAASTRAPAADVLPPAVLEAQILVEPLPAPVVAVPEPLLTPMAPPKLEELIDLSALDIPDQTPDAAPSAAVNLAPESDELLPASVEAEARDDAQPLFNPDAPFTVPMPLPQAAKAAPRFRSRTAAAMAAALIVIAGGALAAAVYLGGESATPALGTLNVTSNPSGVPVYVDGVDRGVTPARITLAPGSHILELRRGVPRVIPFTLSAGAEVSQYLEFAEAPLLGHLAVQSEPAGARVFVDGIERGVAPLTLDDLTPGEHDVMLQTEQAVSRHRVTVAAGGTASLVVPIAGAASGPVSGWVAIKAPFRIEIHEQGRLLGTNDAERLMLSAGRHELEFVNASLAYKVTRVVQVPPGRTASIELELPRGVVSLNASPWAEVWINGERVGDTPIGNLSVPIGAHELVFRHPQFGEKRHAISVTLGAPVRVSVDMKQE
ncbi:MAG: PEGA domain-containing protein [Acidobacteria bacterium]|nr:PEGA domain-containing protein [Acidobacteriota bacterium]